MKKIFLIICVISVLLFCSCNDTDPNYTDAEIQKQINEVCMYDVPNGFGDGEYDYGYQEEYSDNSIGSDEVFSVTYFNKDGNVQYTIYLEKCKNGQGDQLYDFFANKSSRGSKVEYKTKTSDSVLKAISLSHSEKDNNSVMYEYYVLAGKNVIRINARCIDNSIDSNTKALLDGFEAFLDTVTIK